MLNDIDLLRITELLSPPNDDQSFNGPCQNYFLPSEFNTFMHDNLLHQNFKNGFSCLHLNCRSLKKNADSLISFLNGINLDFCAVGVTETWLNSNDPSYDIEGYNFIGSSRQERRGGGVGAFIRNDLNFVHRKEFDIFSESIECIFIEIQSKPKNILFSVIYRPPNSSLPDFIESLTTVLNNVTQENKLLYCSGDYNLNLLNADSCPIINDFLDVFITKSMYPVIHLPTRVTNQSATLIDNIFTNDLNNISCGIFLVDISDHFPVFCIHRTAINSENRKFVKRDINDRTINIFIDKLKHVRWNINTNDPNINYNLFMNQFMKLYDECFPKIEFKHKYRKDKPWFTRDLRKMCNKKYLLYKKYLKNATPYRERTYKSFRNKVNKEIRRIKNEYFRKLFVEVKLDMKKTWQIINKAIGNKHKQTVIDSLKLNDDVIVHGKDIAEAFNDYFVNIGSTLTNNIQCNIRNTNYVQYLKKNNETAFFNPITPGEIIKIVSNFKNQSSAGYDEIDIRIVKKAIHIICFPLCNIFNLMLTTGIFPDKLKIARVVPIFKSGSHTDLSNYRPISVLPVFSKVIEKCLYNRLSKFLEKYDILSTSQYGFRSGHSTSSALIDLVNKVSSTVDSHQILVGLFLDLSKAFDTLDHSILLAKLHNYGIRGILLNLFENYLVNRKQFVIANNIQSELKTIGCGVPQGSILGPLLFLIYINDICNVTKKLKYILYADDTSLFMSDTNIDNLILNFNLELQNVSQWLLVNKLILNVNKTQCMLFTHKKIDYDNIVVKMNNYNVNVTTSLKFLGVTIDCKLSWHNHINEICNKIAKCLGILYKLRSFPRNILLMIYNAIISPHLHYCNTTWSNTTNYSMQRLFRLQKKAVRFVFHANFLAHTAPIFYQLKLLNIFDLYNMNIAIFMYLCFNNLIPKSISICFKLKSEIHDYNTRNPLDYNLPLARTNISMNSIFYKGPKIWNDLPLNIKSSPSLNVFKRRYKELLLERYEHNV